MKRISVLALGCALLLSLGGCGQSDAPSSTADTNTTPTSAPITEAAETPADVVAEATTATEEQALGEQITETGDAEASEADATSAQPMALRIAEMQPEPASKWKEGVNYTRLVPTQPTNAAPGQVEVTEVFWYGCPHCYALDPYLESWRKNGKPAFVSFVRLPVMWSQGHVAHARMFYTAESLGRLEEMHGKLFREMQVNRNLLNSPALIEKFFTDNGVSQADFQKAFSSFAVESSLKRAEALGLRYKVESVPLIVINGKYVTDVGRAGGQQQLIALINELASRERGT
jgi:thiol:disulfide interchange protein DsbA